MNEWMNDGEDKRKGLRRSDDTLLFYTFASMSMQIPLDSFLSFLAHDPQGLSEDPRIGPVGTRDVRSAPKGFLCKSGKIIPLYPLMHINPHSIFVAFPQRERCVSPTLKSQKCYSSPPLDTLRNRGLDEARVVSHPPSRSSLPLLLSLKGYFQPYFTATQPY